VSGPLLTYAALRRVPAVALACDAVHQGRLGRRLAVYASVRTVQCQATDLPSLSAPLLALIIDALQEQPVAVTAAVTSMRPGASAWLLILKFASGLVATLDVGALLPPGFPADPEIRFEFLGTDEALLVEPDALSVRVYSMQKVKCLRCDVPAESYLGQGSGPRPSPGYPDAERAALRVVEAALQAVASGQPVPL
jgi:predicted dehydrogenase